MSVTDTKPNGHGKGEGNGSLSPQEGGNLTPSLSLMGEGNERAEDRAMTPAERAALYRRNKKLREQGMAQVTDGKPAKSKKSDGKRHGQALPAAPVTAAHVAEAPQSNPAAVTRDVMDAIARDVTEVERDVTRDAEPVTPAAVTPLTVDRDASRDAPENTAADPDQAVTEPCSCHVTPVTRPASRWSLFLFTASRAAVTVPVTRDVTPVTLKNVTPKVTPAVTVTREAPRDVTPERDARPVTWRRRWGAYIWAFFRPMVLIMSMVSVACATADFGQGGGYLSKMGVETQDRVVLIVTATVPAVVTIFGFLVMRELVRFRLWVLLVPFIPFYGYMVYMNASHSAGFTSANVGDTIAGRQRDMAVTAAVGSDLTFKIEERNRLSASAPTPVSEATVKGAETAFALLCPKNKNTPQCRLESGKLTQLRKDRDVTRQIEDYTRDIPDLRKNLGQAKPVGSADTMLSGMRRIGRWFWIDLTGDQVEELRTAGWALIGMFAGFAALLATGIWRGYVTKQLGEGW